MKATAEHVLDNLINGNLADAKLLAKRVSRVRLYQYAIDILGWPSERATKAVFYLKDDGSFQAYCDSR